EGLAWIALTTEAVEATQPLGLYFAPSGTTTGPDVPGLPLWMWAATGMPIPLTWILQQTFVPLKVIVASPAPPAAPFGTSAEPRSDASSLPERAAVASAATGAARATTAASASSRPCM